MPYDTVTQTFTRVWKFVDQFLAGDNADRTDFDVAFDDLASGLQGVSDHLGERIAQAVEDGKARPVVFKTTAEMVANTELTDEQIIGVLSGYGDAVEVFIYDATSTKTADGALIVSATGMGVGRLISQRKTLASVPDLLADNRGYETYSAGERVEAEEYLYRVAPLVAVDFHLTTAGGVNLYVEHSSVFKPVDVTAIGVVEGDAGESVMTANVAAIQAIKDKFGAIHFPGGSYYFNAGIDLSPKSSFSITGDGKNLSKVRFVGTMAYGLKIGNHAGSRQEEFRLSGIAFLGNIVTDNAGHADDVYGVDRMIDQGGLANQVIYEDLDIRYATTGIYSLDNANNWNRTFREVSIRFVKDGIASAEANGNVFDRVDVFEFTGTGIRVNGFGIRISGCSIESSVSTASPLGIYIYGFGFQITGNYFEGMFNGIAVDGSAVTPSCAGIISGNYMVGLSKAANSYAVNLTVASGCSIQNNWFRDFDIGIRSDSGSSSDNTIDPNFYDVNSEVLNGYGCHRIGQAGVFDFSGAPRMDIKARDRNFGRGTVIRTDWTSTNGVIDLYLNDGIYSAASTTFVGTNFVPTAGSSKSLGDATREWANVVTDQIQMRSPSGTLWTITVDNTGNLVVS